MSGLFEHLAYTEQADGVERRKAIALARARANRRFAKFVHAGVTEAQKSDRLALVAGDMQEAVRQACAEVGYSDWEDIYEGITASFGMVHEGLRKPKVCPYHREVMDISLAAGDPAAGFSAMAQHAWGANHCQGEWDGGRCNFKPEMATQTYWDQKAEKAEERRQERERQQEQTEPPPELPDFEHEETEEGPIPAEAQGVAPDNTGIEQGFAEERENVMENVSPSADLAPAMASTRQAEALKTIDVEQAVGPVPTMNKQTWTPENIQWDKDAEMSGSPHPTRDQDIKQPADYGNGEFFGDDGRFDQTRAVTETQDVTQEGGLARQNGQGTGQWSGNQGQANPVTSAQDPDKNPLKDDDDEEEEENVS